jgi:hypothetical protein
MGSISTIWNGSFCTYPVIRALVTPWTSTLSRPSGIFSMRMIVARVPTEWTSSGPGSSVFSSFWVEIRICRLAVQGRIHGLMDFSRPTNRGKIM